MTSKKNNFSNKWVERFRLNSFFNISPEKAIDSLKAISKIIFVFIFIFMATWFFKLYNIEDTTTKHFRLIISNTDILPLYKADLTTFIFLVVYEFLKMITMAFTFFFFIKFLNSLDINDPFKNNVSADHLNKVAVLSIVFFMVDAINSMHWIWFDIFPDKTTIQIFHFEYLFLAYFINVFSVVFKRGVDLNNEIDLVI